MDALQTRPLRQILLIISPKIAGRSISPPMWFFEKLSSKETVKSYFFMTFNIILKSHLS